VPLLFNPGMFEDVPLPLNTEMSQEMQLRQEMFLVDLVADLLAPRLLSWQPEDWV
jgi:hypothetical protein